MKLSLFLRVFFCQRSFIYLFYAVFLSCLFLSSAFQNSAFAQSDGNYPEQLTTGDGVSKLHISRTLPGLRITYRLDSAPMQFRNEQGHADGIIIDLWRLWSIKAGIPVHFIGAYNKESQQMVIDGRADINAGLFENKKRAEFLDFSSPIVNSAYYLFYQPTIKHIQSISDFKPYSLGVTRGSFHETYMRKYYPDLELSLFDGYQAMFAAAGKGEIQGFISQPHYLSYFLQQNKKSTQTVPEYKQLRPALYARDYKASVRKGNTQLLMLINQNLSLLTAEDRRVVMQNWLGRLTAEANSRDKEKISLTEKEKNWLSRHPVIDIGVDGNWPPVDFINGDGRHSGIAHEFLEKISALLGIQFNVIPGPAFKDMLDNVKNGRLNIAMTIVKTPEREKYLWFSAPYFSTHKIIVSREGGKSFQSPEDLTGKTVVMEEAYYSVNLIKKNYPKIKLKLVSSTLEALKQVSWGKADAYIGNAAVVQWLMKKNQIMNLEVTGDAGLPPSEQRFAIHKSEQWQPLPGILNKALALIDDKQRTLISRQWLGERGMAKTIYERLQLTLKEREWLAKHSQLRLGINTSWPPVEFIDTDGSYQGLAAEFIKMLALSLDLNIVPQKNLAWSQVIDRAKNKELDVLPALSPSEERKEYLNFTDVYLDFPIVIFVNEQRIHTTSLADLYGKKVAVEKSYITQEYLQRDYPEIDLLLVKNSREGLEKVSLGEVDAYVGNLTVASYILTGYGISNVKIGGTTPYSSNLRMGVRKDWPELVTILNKYLRSLSMEEKSQIRQKWLTVKYDVNVDNYKIKIVIFIAAVLLLMSLLWSLFVRRKNARLKRSEEQLNKIINTIPLAIILTDKNGQIIKANPHVAEEFEIESKQIAGQNIKSFYDDIKERNRVLKKINEEGMARDMQVHFRTGNGGIVTGLLSATPIRLGNQTFNLGMFVNLTERIKMEEALKKAKEESEQASQFKSNFLANMSHEIRTPMNAIIGMTHLALQTPLNKKQFDYINKVKISAHNLLGIINDILDFSKIEAGKLSLEKAEFHLDQVLENLSGIINVKAVEKNIELLFHRDMSIPGTLVGDSLRLTQVLINLAQNAIKFTAQGEVIIAAELISSENNKCQIQFSVSDTGIGIDGDRLQALFEPFVQADNSTSRKYGGTGLGLTICKQIIELMGGELKASSEPGKGSVFSFLITLGKTDNPANERMYQCDQDLKGLRVLLVDDNPVAREILQEMLESFSFQVSTACCAREAYALLEPTDGTDSGSAEPFELIIIDWRMPDVNGIEAIRFIQEEMSIALLPKFILITAYEQEALLQQSQHINPDAFLTKPVNPSMLFDTIISVFSHDREKLPEEAPALSTKRLQGVVLLVEDNHINQQVATELLEGFGLLVVIASNGQEALQKIHETTFDLVLMDIQMPGMDGLEATQLLRQDERFLQLPIIAMTAHAMDGDREACLNAGMNDYLSKPIDPEILLNKVKKWLRNSDFKNALQSVHSSYNASEITGAFPDVPDGIDLSWGLQRVGGNMLLFEKLLREFYQKYADCCTTIKQLLHSGELDSARRFVHTIHGVAGNIGAIDLQSSGRMLELSIRDNNVDIQQSLLLVRDFCVQSQVVFQLINRLIGQWDNKKSDKTEIAAQNKTLSDTMPAGTVTADLLKAHLDNLQKLLSNGDSKACLSMESLRNMVSLSHLEIDEQLLEQLEQQINDYEFDEALETLLQLNTFL